MLGTGESPCLIRPFGRGGAGDPSKDSRREAVKIRSVSVLRVTAIVLSFLSLCQCGPALWETQKSEGNVSVFFTYVAPEAKKVCISGSFNHWSKTTHCLTRNGETWSIEIPLPPGKHSYLFIIDENRWEVDPEAPLREESDFGIENSVLTVQ